MPRPFDLAWCAFESFGIIQLGRSQAAFILLSPSFSCNSVSNQGERLLWQSPLSYNKDRDTSRHAFESVSTSGCVLPAWSCNLGTRITNVISCWLESHMGNEGCSFGASGDHRKYHVRSEPGWCKSHIGVSWERHSGRSRIYVDQWCIHRSGITVSLWLGLAGSLLNNQVHLRAFRSCLRLSDLWKEQKKKMKIGKFLQW